MYKFNKLAGLILDQQDDPGAGWEIISHFWPEDLEPPSFGQDVEKVACAIALTDGMEKIARYPVDTPTNALASSMYFLAFGKDSIDSLGDIQKIASDLQEYRIAWGVHLPEGFVQFLKEGSQEQEVQEVYADHDGRLPVTTPEQAEASIKLFIKKASLWPSDQRMLYSARLEKAAQHHGLDVELPYAGRHISKHASGAIDLRLMLINQVTNGIDNAEFSGYVDGMETIKVAMDEAATYEDILKIASEIESLDQEFGMDEAWDVQVPNPVDTILEGFNSNPFHEVEKAASVDWDSVDWSELPLEESYVDAIKENPEVIIPTLPTAQRQLVEDHVYGRSEI